MSELWKTFNGVKDHPCYYTEYKNGYLVIRELVSLDDFSIRWALLETLSDPSKEDLKVDKKLFSHAVLYQVQDYAEQLLVNEKV